MSPVQYLTRITQLSTVVPMTIARMRLLNNRRVGILDVEGKFHLAEWDTSMPNFRVIESFYADPSDKCGNSWSFFTLLHSLPKEIVFHQAATNFICRCFLPVEESRQPIQIYTAHHDEIVKVDVNKSGSLLFSISKNGFLSLWDLFSMTLIDSATHLQMALVTQMTFLGPNKVVVGLSTGQCYLWDLSNFKITFLKVIVISASPIQCLTTQITSAQSSWLIAVNSGTSSCSVYVRQHYNHEEWKLLFNSFKQNVSSETIIKLKISPCGKFLASIHQSCYTDCILLVHDLSSKEVVTQHILASLPCLVEFLMTSDDPLDLEMDLKVLIAYVHGIPQFELYPVTFRREHTPANSHSSQCTLSVMNSPEDMHPRLFPLPGPETLNTMSTRIQSATQQPDIIKQEDMEVQQDDPLSNLESKEQLSCVEKETETVECENSHLALLPEKVSISSIIPTEHSYPTLKNSLENCEATETLPKTTQYSSKLTLIQLQQLEKKQLDWNRLKTTTPMKQRIEELKIRKTRTRLPEHIYTDLPPIECAVTSTKTKVLPKQLDKNWLKKCALRPQIEDFWQPQTCIKQENDAGLLDDTIDEIDHQLSIDALSLLLDLRNRRNIC